jgi:hypothetical protein
MRAVDGRSEAAVIRQPEQGGTMPKIAEGELEWLKATPMDDPGGQFALPRKRFLVSGT